MSVLPDVKYFDPKLLGKVANLEMIARLVVEGMITGLHRSPHQGFSVEFAEYRKYVAGDEPRFIDWKLFSKTDRLYLKTFQEETNLRCNIVIDSSGSMGFKNDESEIETERLSKFEYACYAAAALSYLMVRQQDAVGLVTFSKEIETYMAPRSTAMHLKDILKKLETISTGEDTNISNTFHQLAERLKRRGLIIVFSDLFDDPEEVVRGLAHFRHKRHEVVVFHILHPQELELPDYDVVEFIDMETDEKLNIQTAMVREEYAERMKAFVADYRRRCANQNIDYIPVTTSTPLDLTLINYLSKRSRLF